MNKNPFVPQPSYQPPLPPGPPPPQPNQPDYSAYWAAAAQQQQSHIQQQPPTVGTFNQQWAPPQPPRPPAEQSALYANYGYGTQNNHWRQPQQQQPQHYHPPPPPQAHPPPPAQPGYSPYQPTAGYQQPYVPQAQPMAAPYPQPQPPQTPQQQQQQFFPHPPPQQHHLPQHPQHQVPMQMQQPRNIHHTPPQHMPPAKRQRFDGPTHNQNHRAPPPQPQFQVPTGPMQAGPFSGPPRGGGPGGNHVPLGGGNRGGPVSGPGRGGPVGARGGRGGSSMTGNRGGGMAGRGGRGGGNYSGGGAPGGRGGSSGGPVRGHNSRGNFGGNKDYHNRRGGGSFNAGGGGGSFQNQSGSFRARGQNHTNSGRGRNDGGGGGSSTFGARDGTTNSSFTSGKKDENRRTLTDFKIVGLEIRELAWTWGVLPSSPVKTEPKEVSLGTDDASQGTVKAEAAEEDTVKPALADESDAVASSSSVQDVKAAPAPDALPAPKVVPDIGPPPSRMRIYFHTPVTAVDSHPIPHNGSFSLGAAPSDSRKGKRKKIESDDGDFEEGRRPPPPPGMHDDRSSVAASVAPSVAETASEADWLMAAIAGEPEGDSHGPDGNDDDEHRDNDGATDGGAETDTDGNYVGAGADMAEAPAHDAHAFGTHDEASAEPDVSAVPEGLSASFSSKAMDGGAVPYVNGHDGAPPEAVTDIVSGPAPPASDASLSPLVSSAAKDDQAAGPVAASSKASVPVADVSSVPLSGPTEQADPVTDRPNTPILEANPVQGVQSLLTLSNTATLLSVDNPAASSSLEAEATVVVPPENGHVDEQTQEEEATQVDEPPPSLTVSAASTTYGEAYQPVKPEAKGPKVPAANRLSISYEGGNRRIVFDAEVVETITLYRREARAEVRMNLVSDGETGFKGILMETLSEVTKSYNPIQSPTNSNDFPPFSQATTPLAITLIVYLDTARPLSEPKWVKTGDIPEWLKSLFGRMFWFAGDAAESWEKKIIVSDPDPPPTLSTVLEGWSTSSSAGTLTERQRFLKTHLTEIDNVLEILLRLVRGDRTAPLAQTSAPSLSGPLQSALTPGSAHGSQQTPVSLAVLAMFRMTVEYADKAAGDKGKAEVEERVGEIIRCLPASQIHKSLDAIFKEWKVEKKR